MWAIANLDVQTPWGSCHPNFKCHKWGSERAGQDPWFESLSQGHFPDLAFGLLSKLALSTASLLCLLNVYRTLRLFDPQPYI